MLTEAEKTMVREIQEQTVAEWIEEYVFYDELEVVDEH